MVCYWTCRVAAIVQSFFVEISCHYVMLLQLLTLTSTERAELCFDYLGFMEIHGAQWGPGAQKYR